MSLHPCRAQIARVLLPGHFEPDGRVVSRDGFGCAGSEHRKAVAVLLFLPHFVGDRAFDHQISNRLMFVGLRQRDPQAGNTSITGARDMHLVDERERASFASRGFFR